MSDFDSQEFGRRFKTWMNELGVNSNKLSLATRKHFGPGRGLSHPYFRWLEQGLVDPRKLEAQKMEVLLWALGYGTANKERHHDVTVEEFEAKTGLKLPSFARDIAPRGWLSLPLYSALGEARGKPKALPEVAIFKDPQTPGVKALRLDGKVLNDPEAKLCLARGDAVLVDPEGMLGDLLIYWPAEQSFVLHPSDNTKWNKKMGGRGVTLGRLLQRQG